jgi:hypothetical protein
LIIDAYKPKGHRGKEGRRRIRRRAKRRRKKIK